MLAIALVFLTAAVMNLEAAEINCEKINSLDLYGNSCYLDEKTAISAVNVTIVDLENDVVLVILFRNNKKIQLLPINIYRNFPNLEIYFANNASIKEISALNFRRLTSLNFLDLSSNQIEFIPNFCFTGLSELGTIYLGMKDHFIRCASYYNL